MKYNKTFFSLVKTWLQCEEVIFQTILMRQCQSCGTLSLDISSISHIPMQFLDQCQYKEHPKLMGLAQHSSIRLPLTFVQALSSIVWAYASLLNQQPLLLSKEANHNYQWLISSPLIPKIVAICYGPRK